MYFVTLRGKIEIRPDHRDKPGGSPDANFISPDALIGERRGLSPPF
jgi:hypothetical protein